MREPSRIVAARAQALDVPMSVPFEIATGTRTRVANILARVRLASGAEGFGEGAPIGYQGETQAAALKAARHGLRGLIGRPADRWRELIEDVDSRIAPFGSARAAVSMALLDAWCRHRRVPLRWLFGGAETRLRSDVTVTILTPPKARDWALRLKGLGIQTVKIKIGRDVAEDVERVEAVAAVDRRFKIMLDANCGYGPAQSLRLLARLKRRGIRPVLFEQPAPRADWKGLAEVERRGGVPVAADESVTCRAEAWRAARARAFSAVNIKLMKYGLLEAWDIAQICRGAGIKLMIGGMVETSLAMACAAHFAAGLGNFAFVDLDTPLWLKDEPMRGPTLGRGGIWDLSTVRAGIGVEPA